MKAQMTKIFSNFIKTVRSVKRKLVGLIEPMSGKSFPDSIGPSTFEPLSFPNLEEICKRLDRLYISSDLKQEIMPSDMFRGALAAIHKDYRVHNPDWMSQAANSLREILYDYDKRGDKDRKMGLDYYGSAYDISRAVQELGSFYHLFQCLTHHDFVSASENPLVEGSKKFPVDITPEVFENLVYRFGNRLYWVLLQQLDIHKEIDVIVEQYPQIVDLPKIIRVVNFNLDAKRYFFSIIDHTWINLLWENGQIDEIKAKSEDYSRDPYLFLDLNYLLNASKENPHEVADIILDENVATSKENLNTEVISYFLRIAGELPPDDLKKVVVKIKSQSWVQLFHSYSTISFEYQKILNTLSKADDNESVLALANEILKVKPRELIEKGNYSLYQFKPFYLEDLDNTKVFQYLIELNDSYLEQAFDLVNKKMGQIILLGDETREIQVYSIYEPFELYDVDFFSIQPRIDQPFTSSENIHELAAVMKMLGKRFIESNKGDPQKLLNFHKKYISEFPNCQTMWRLRLFFLSLNPTIYAPWIEQSLNKIFDLMKDSWSFSHLTSGAEYKKLLKFTFSSLNKKFQQQYIGRIFEVITKHRNEILNNKVLNTQIFQILSCICEHLSQTERIFLKEFFGTDCDPTYLPKPVISSGPAGFINPRGPIPLEEFQSMSVIDIIQKLKEEWSPENLDGVNQYEDFFNPINSEGVGNQLKDDIERRPNEYLTTSGLFIDTQGINKRYIYSFFSGIREILKSHIEFATQENIINLLDSMKSLTIYKQDNKTKKSERDDGNENELGPNWQFVYQAMAELLAQLLINCKDGGFSFAELRARILNLLDYLLEYPDPKVEDEELTSAKITESHHFENKTYVTNPYSNAMNSVRGIALNALVSFISIDNQENLASFKDGIPIDVMEILGRLISQEETRAIFFLFGRFLPFLISKDQREIYSKIDEIFPINNEKNHLRLAAWEGYLTNNPSRDIFFDNSFQKQYEMSLNYSKQDDPDRRFFIDPEEGLARHVAIALIYYNDEFDFDSDLFIKFWADNEKRKIAFIDFVGRKVISRNAVGARRWLQENQSCIMRLKDLWDFILENETSPKVCSSFGHWINVDMELFDPEWLVKRVRITLERTNGILNWSFGLIQFIEKYFDVDPKETIKILRLFLLEGSVRATNRGFRFYPVNQLLNPIKFLYLNPGTTIEIENLISKLMQEGGKDFWQLEEILKT